MVCLMHMYTLSNKIFRCSTLCSPRKVLTCFDIYEVNIIYLKMEASLLLLH
jgi:hypothetical protein